MMTNVTFRRIFIPGRVKVMPLMIEGDVIAFVCRGICLPLCRSVCLSVR